MLIRTLALSALALASALSAAEPVAAPATAGIATRGWTQTQGGRGGRLIKVTTLAPSAPAA